MNSIISEILENRYCKGCILSGRKDHICVRDETIKINMGYVPEKINILFVAESPPMAFLKDRISYFYAPGSIRYGNLFYYTMSVLFKDEMMEYSGYVKEHFLKRFRDEKKFYLIDMVKCPINRLTGDEKRKATEFCSKYLNRELKSLNFQKAIFIGKRSFKRAKVCLDLDFDYVVIPLPFRSDENVRKFREKLTTFFMLKRHVQEVC